MQGSIQQRSSGSWRVRVYVGRDELGTKRYIGRSVRGTKREAQRVRRGSSPRSTTAATCRRRSGSSAKSSISGSR